MKPRGYDPTDRVSVMRALRRQILAAQLKVTLDKKLGRETSTQVLELSKMPLPPIERRKSTKSQCCSNCDCNKS